MVDVAGWSRPTRLLNLLLVAAIVFSVGSYFAGGTYEVVWSLYLTSLGADLAAIGLTFFTFALPPLLLSPFTGSFIDRAGGFFALVVGLAGIGICGLLYPLVPEIWWVVVLGLVEGTAFALGRLPSSCSRRGRHRRAGARRRRACWALPGRWARSSRRWRPGRSRPSTSATRSGPRAW